MIKMVRTSQRI